jgi:hypothetical protein
MSNYPKSNANIDAAAAIIANLDSDAERQACDVAPAQRAQLHLLLSIARSLHSLDRFGIDVSTR